MLRSVFCVTWRQMVIAAAVFGLLFLGLAYSGWLTAQWRYYTADASPQASAIQPPIGNTKPYVVIPAIGVYAPVIVDQPSRDGAHVQSALQNGVLLYGDSAPIGAAGNTVIVGHSSGRLLSPGHYKWIFTLLDKLKAGDSIGLNSDGKSYRYTVTGSQVVGPNDSSVLAHTAQPTLTLITCTPVGTNEKRLVVRAQL